MTEAQARVQGSGPGFRAQFQVRSYMSVSQGKIAHNLNPAHRPVFFFTSYFTPCLVNFPVTKERGH